MGRRKKIVQDHDEESEGVSYEKGREFELSFAQFMKTDLEWHKIRVGAHLAGKQNQKGANIDIIGEKLDAKGVRYKNYANNWMISSLLFMILAVIYYVHKWGEHGIWFMIFFLSVFAGGVLFRILSDIYNKQNSWVECKNLKSKVNINHVSKMIREIEDYKASKNEDYRFTHFYFASSSGFVENALKLATDHRITCYVQDGNTFRVANYWN